MRQKCSAPRRTIQFSRPPTTASSPRSRRARRSARRSECALYISNMIKTRSVWTDIKKDDGLRILISRFRGRGLPTSQYDVWMPSLGPSEQLLRAILSGEIDWKTYTKRYKEELFLDGPIDARSKTIKNHGQKSTLRLLRKL